MNVESTYLYWYLQRKRRKKNIRKDGHSPYGQDRVVFDLLGRPPNGIFVDIGANDGTTFSNSLLFEEKGWIGLCVEPHPVLFETLKQNRKCHLLNACISDRDGKADFLVVEGSAHMLSGILEFMDERHLDRIEHELAGTAGNKCTLEIQTLSPQTLLKRFAFERIDYLSIDTEGCELAILKTFDVEKTPVRMIGVENGTRSAALFRYMRSIGYKLVLCVGCDEIYQRSNPA